MRFKPWMLIILCLLICLIAWYFLIFKEIKKQENFTPGLRAMYRPHVRSMRIYFEKNYKKLRNQANVFLSKLGIL